MTHWLCGNVIGPIIKYASVVRWTAMDNLEESPKNVLPSHQRGNEDYISKGFRDYSLYTPNKNLDWAVFAAMKLYATEEWINIGHKTYN